jgi:oxygen-independent coproporphyrinogen-3 oxidase
VSGEPFALYVHLPWCRHVCPYCDFNVVAGARPPEDDYVAALLAELAAHVAADTWRGRPAATCYLGGGTPSLFSPAAVGRLLDGVAERCGLASEPEVTLEANPGTVDRERLTGYRAAGVNRLSLGAQSFQPARLRTLGRDHMPEETVAAVGSARAAGIDNVSLDLIYGVPGQRVADWEADLSAALALAPEHVSAYALTWEPGTPFHARRASGRLEPIAEDDEATMAALAVERLEAAGLARYEISSFARPGRASRHNTRYWDGSDYLGLGAGAHSFSRDPFPGRRWMNERPPAAWTRAVTAHGTAVATEERLTVAQARGEFCWTGLRRAAGVDLEAFRRRFGVDVLAVFPRVDTLLDEHLVEVAAGHLRLTRRGFAFADTVSATFI